MRAFSLQSNATSISKAEVHDVYYCCNAASEWQRSPHVRAYPCVVWMAFYDARCICSGKCRHNSIENDYCGGKPGLSPSPLILTLTLTLNPNLRTFLNLTLTLLTRLTLIDSLQTLVYRRNSHFRCYCGGIYRRKRFILLRYTIICKYV